MLCKGTKNGANLQFFYPFSSQRFMGAANNTKTAHKIFMVKNNDI